MVDAGPSPRAENGPVVRPARDEDAAGLIALIGGCFAEYPGCVLDVDGEMPELRAISSAFRVASGRFWVAEAAGRIVGSVGLVPAAAPGTAELRKLYVDRTARRQGLGARLVGLAEAEARAWGATVLELWSDTRFADAHRLYERLGFVRRPGTRELHDLSNSVEYSFVKDLAAWPAASRATPPT